MESDPALIRTLLAWSPFFSYLAFMAVASLVNRLTGRKLVNGGLVFLIASGLFFAWVYLNVNGTTGDKIEAFSYLGTLFLLPVSLSIYHAMRFRRPQEDRP